MRAKETLHAQLLYGFNGTLPILNYSYQFLCSNTFCQVRELHVFVNELFEHGSMFLEYENPFPVDIDYEKMNDCDLSELVVALERQISDILDLPHAMKEIWMSFF